MPGRHEDDRGYETPKWRTFWLVLGFVALVGIGIITVLRPELDDQSRDDKSAEAAERETAEPVQE
ncbi:MAG: hypothetical protein WCE62_12875 [Polyangiales bacterium]